MIEIVQVVPQITYKVWVYFADGKITEYDMNPNLEKGVFKQLRDIDIFINRCCIMNDTLAWDVGQNGEEDCIDIDPVVLYSSPELINECA